MNHKKFVIKHYDTKQFYNLVPRNEQWENDIWFLAMISLINETSSEILLIIETVMAIV
jgi:hypothetical protein